MPSSSSNARSEGAPKCASNAGAENPDTHDISNVAASHRRDLAALRREVMLWVRALKETPKSGVESGAIDRLLGKNDGVFDGLHIAVQTMLRLIDKEREVHTPTESPDATPIPADFFSIAEGDDLDRRITAELDRIAARGSPPEGFGTDRADQ